MAPDQSRDSRKCVCKEIRFMKKNHGQSCSNQTNSNSFTNKESLVLLRKEILKTQLERATTLHCSEVEITHKEHYLWSPSAVIGQIEVLTNVVRNPRGKGGIVKWGAGEPITNKSRVWREGFKRDKFIHIFTLIWYVTFSTCYNLKGMFHMITMLTSKTHIDITEYKNPFKYLKTNPCYPILAPFCILKISVISKNSCLTIQKRPLTIQKKVPGNAKKNIPDSCPPDLYS